MLNEVKEYLQYTTELQDSKRISYHYITEGTADIRPLVIIARRFLFHNKDFSPINWIKLSIDERVKRSDKAVTAMKIWKEYGMSETLNKHKISHKIIDVNYDTAGYEELIKNDSSVYALYIDSVITAKKEASENTKTISNVLTEKYSYGYERMNCRFFGDELYSKKFDYNVLTYDQVIAIAIEQGPLHDISIALPKKILKDIHQILFDNNRVQNRSVYYFMVIMYIAYHQKVSGSNIVQLKNSDLVMWFSNRKIGQYLNADLSYVFLKDDDTLILREKYYNNIFYSVSKTIQDSIRIIPEKTHVVDDRYINFIDEGIFTLDYIKRYKNLFKEILS